MTSANRTVALCLVVVTVGQFPAFLTGASAVQIRSELDFSVALLGLAISGFFVVSATASVVAGQVVERVGWRSGLLLGTMVTVVSLTGIALQARSWGQLAGLLALAGLGNALSQPAANLALVTVVSPRRYGLVFGIKQSAILFATLLGGLSVPVIALTIGWRWTYGFAALAGGLSAVAIRWLTDGGRAVTAESSGDLDRSSEQVPDNPPLRPSTPRAHNLPARAMRVLLLVATVGFGSAMVGNALAAFLVSSAVTEGMSPGRAGLLLAVSSLLGLTVRIGIGWLADHRPIRPLRAMAFLLSLGAAGCVLLALGSTFIIIGAMLAVGAGWGWPGLYNLAVVRAYPSVAAAATGVSQTGIYLGAAFGPVLLGLIADTVGFTGLWLATAAIALASAAMALGGHRALARQGR